MSRLKRHLLGLFFLLMLLFYARSFAFAADGRVLRMDVDARVLPNAALEVTERFSYTTDRSDTYGPLRMVLTGWRQNEESVKADFEVVSAMLNGGKVPYTIRNSPQYTLLHLGDKNYLTPGRTYDYVLRYRITDLIQFRRDIDWLYWSVTGSGAFPIEHVSLGIHLPEGATIRSQDAWTGTYDNYRTAERHWRRTASGRFETTRPLGSREMLLALAGWDKGFVNPPTRSERAAKAGRDLGTSFLQRLHSPFDGENRGAFALCVLLVVAPYAAASRIWSRKPRRNIAKTLLFSPPPNMEAGYAGYVKTLAFDEGLLLADLVQLATQGQIFLEPRRDCLKVDRAAVKWGDDVSPAHQRLLQALFPRDEKSVLLGGATKEGMIPAHALVARMPAFYKTSGREHYAKKDRRLTSSHTAICVALLVLFAPLLYAALTMETPLSAMLADWRSLPAFWAPVVALPLLLFWLAWRVAREAIRDFRTVRRTPDARGILRAVVKWAPVALLAFFVLPQLKRALIAHIGLFFTQDPLLVSGLWLAFGAALFVFASMPVRTREGWRLLEQAEGFEAYLNAAGGDEIRQLPAAQRDLVPPKTVERYERLLPYSFALDAAGAWTESHIHLLSRTEYRPRWLLGAYGLHSFTKKLLQAESAMCPIPFLQGVERMMKHGEKKQKR